MAQLRPEGSFFVFLFSFFFFLGGGGGGRGSDELLLPSYCLKRSCPRNDTTYQARLQNEFY